MDKLLASCQRDDMKEEKVELLNAGISVTKIAT
jgi:hypothetical protein